MWTGSSLSFRMWRFHLSPLECGGFISLL
jgi:hypothetical protein